MTVLLALAGCTATAAPDSVATETADVEYAPECRLPDFDGVDSAAENLYSVGFTLVSAEGAPDAHDATGAASLDAAGVLGWDVVPSGSLDVVVDAQGFTGWDAVVADGGTPEGCNVDASVSWEVAAIWDDRGGFSGTWTFGYSETVCGVSCSAKVSFTAVGTSQ